MKFHFLKRSQQHPNSLLFFKRSAQLPHLSMVSCSDLFAHVQRSAKLLFPGCVYFCLALPGSCLSKQKNFLAALCINTTKEEEGERNLGHGILKTCLPRFCLTLYKWPQFILSNKVPSPHRLGTLFALHLRPFMI